MVTKRLRDSIRHVQDFPKKGIGFKDITTLLKDPNRFKEAVDALVKPYTQAKVHKVVAIEARGFLLASAMAYQLHAGLVPVRKPKKLPAPTLEESYTLEYGTDKVAIHKDAISSGENVLMVDDLLATGGTMAAACRMVEKLGGNIVGVAFLVELDFLKGRKKLGQYPLHVLVHFHSETEES
jgi:adenine phosphoribosyltransferase